MSFRYILRLDDGSDAGEVELEQPANVGDEIRVTGNVRARVRAVVPVEIVEEFVDRPLYGFLEVEPRTPTPGKPTRHGRTPAASSS